MVISAVPRDAVSAVMEPTIATMMLIVNTIHKSSEKEGARKKGRMGEEEGRTGEEGEEGGEDGRGGRRRREGWDREGEVRRRSQDSINAI